MDGLLLLASIVEELAPPRKKPRLALNGPQPPISLSQTEDKPHSGGFRAAVSGSQKSVSICVGSLCEWGLRNLDLADDADSGSSSGDEADERSPSGDACHQSTMEQHHSDFPGFQVQPIR